MALMPHPHPHHHPRGDGEAILNGAPLPTLLTFAFPIILGNIFQQLYNIVDAMVVGKFLGSIPLGGISVAAPMMDIVNALILGATIGIGVLAAQLCGAGDWRRLKVTHSTALIGGDHGGRLGGVYPAGRPRSAGPGHGGGRVPAGHGLSAHHFRRHDLLLPV